MIEYLSLTFLGYFAAITPGPDCLFVIRNGILYGFKGSLTSALGILTGNIVYLSLVYFGFASLGKIPLFMFITSLFGGCYLLYLTVMSLKESSELKIDFSEENQKTFNQKTLFFKAILLNLSNPKAILFFSSVLTPFLKGNLLLSLLFLYAGISGAFLTAALFSTRLSLIKTQRGILKAANKIIAGLFLLFSVKLFLQAMEAAEGLVKQFH